MMKNTFDFTLNFGYFLFSGYLKFCLDILVKWQSKYIETKLQTICTADIKLFKKQKGVWN